MVLMKAMLEAAFEASQAVDTIYNRQYTTTLKEDGSPITEADAAAERIISQRLAPLGIPLVSEESHDPNLAPPKTGRYFLIDPLDGTKEFIGRNGEFTVNIALVENGYPIAGIVVAPAQKRAWTGDETGAHLIDIETGARRPFAVSCDGPLKIVASRSHRGEYISMFCAKLGAAEAVSQGSSLKFCLVASGGAHLYPRFTPTCGWDTAAGQAVLEAAGGVVLDLTAQRLRYGSNSRGFINPLFIAGSSGKLVADATIAMKSIGMSF
ncbi:3'(2'),5'-bisphosphate nucleotidase CysQ [Agrobacterium tumefaciens]|uniref:3'(2'),5'-bisphosphate nucleotidase CysQ n=1 Tax=Agrobacterium tumefaciens TaxID=358 RepID=UPI00224301A1|nr:3'(2'),5'-bisphosphate nucleotidase CysQ [Agrobacterium tumefaciens]MCW8060206.1 3'(2'),5'-bisphosphate nucleotidase CysQ [Agrobacterium tumefaciens]